MVSRCCREFGMASWHHGVAGMAQHGQVKVSKLKMRLSYLIGTICMGYSKTWTAASVEKRMCEHSIIGTYIIVQSMIYQEHQEQQEYQEYRISRLSKWYQSGINLVPRGNQVLGRSAEESHSFLPRLLFPLPLPSTQYLLANVFCSQRVQSTSLPTVSCDMIPFLYRLPYLLIQLIGKFHLS